MGDRTYNFDINMLLADGVAAMTATGFAQVSGADGIVDFGGNQTPSPKQQARIDAILVVDVVAIDIASGNETYDLQLLLSNDSTFGAGNVEFGAQYSLGKGASRAGVNMLDSVVGRYEIAFSTEQANVKYQFAKLRLVAGGTTPSLQFKAFVSVLPEP